MSDMISRGEKEAKRRSQFSIYSIGMLTEAVERDRMDVEIQPIEMSWASDGGVDSNFQEMRVETDTANGKVTNAILVGNSINATWLPVGESNRISPPCLQKGMLVFIYEDGDNNYYWSDTGLYREKMRLETVTKAYCNNATELNTGVNLNSWWISEISTEAGHLFFQTNTSNGEYTGWLIKLDTKNAVFYIEDDFGNKITFDSKNVLQRIENQLGAFFELNKEDMTVSVPGHINMKAGKTITVESGQDMTLTSRAKFTNTSTGDMTIDTKAKYTLTSGGNYSVTATGIVVITGATYSLNGMSGGGTANGAFSAKGDIKSTDGNIKANKDITAGGNISATGSIKAGGRVEGSNI